MNAIYKIKINFLVTTPESIKELNTAINSQFSALVYVTEDPDNLEDTIDDFLKITNIRFHGQQSVFITNKEILGLYFERHFGRMDLEMENEVLYIIRGTQPVMLELIGDFSQYQGIWGSFEEYRYDKLEPLFRISKDNMYYLIVLDGGCETQEMENILIWHTFRERNKFGQGFLVSKEKEPERYTELTEKWKLTSNCSILFVNRINTITLDKFKPDYDFVGKFTLDDYSRKLTGKFAKPYMVSQSFNQIKGEEDYRLVGKNIDSTWEELNADCAILFYNRNQLDIDDFFYKLRNLSLGKC